MLELIAGAVAVAGTCILIRKLPMPGAARMRDEIAAESTSRLILQRSRFTAVEVSADGPEIRFRFYDTDGPPGNGQYVWVSPEHAAAIVRTLGPAMRAAIEYRDVAREHVRERERETKLLRRATGAARTEPETG